MPTPANDDDRLGDSLQREFDNLFLGTPGGLTALLPEDNAPVRADFYGLKFAITGAARAEYNAFDELQRQREPGLIRSLLIDAWNREPRRVTLNLPAYPWDVSLR